MIKILIAVHKTCELPEDDLYLPVQVHAAASEHFLPCTDDEGDNISILNPKFCELTALYYGWKHLRSEHLGLVHYRRYLSLKGGDSLQEVLTLQQAEELLKQYRLLLPKKRHYYIESLYSHYAHTFDGRHLDIAREIIAEKYPEYLSSFDRVMKETSGYMFNMMVGEKGLTDSYCAWLFPILFELDQRVDSTSMTPFELRYIGRVAERLFNVWLDQQLQEGVLKKEEIRELPYVYLGREPWLKKISAFLSARFLKKKYKKSF